MSRLIRVTDLGFNDGDGEVIVWITGRDFRNKRCHRKIRGTVPYAFIPEHFSLPNENFITNVESGYQGYDGTPLKKVTVQYPKNVNTESNQVDCLTDYFSKENLYEADIPYPRRVSIDYGLSGYIRVPEKEKEIHIDDVETDIDPSDVDNIEPRVMMADIEVLPPDLSGDREFQDFVDDASQPILSITTYDTYTDEYTTIVLDREDLVEAEKIRSYLKDHWEESDKEGYAESDIRLIQCENESSLLESFVQEVEKKRVDLLSGWNWIDFDHKYILNRLKRPEFDNISEHRLSDVGIVGGYRTPQLIDGVPGFDMMEAFCEKMTFGNWRSKSLDYVANEELGVGKVEDMNIGKEYMQNRSRFLAYNIIDTQLLVALDELNGIHEFFYQLSDLSNIQIFDTFWEMRLVDGFVMSHRTDDEILPSAIEENLGKIAGGLVLTPSQGVNGWVGVLDLKSLYPSVFITLNVSEETLTKEGKVDPTINIQGNHGFIASIIDENRNPNGANLICPSMPESEDDVGGRITEDHISWDLHDPVAMGTQIDNEGILPKYLKLLFDERASMKTERDKYDPNDPEYNVYDNKQNAIKVVMNSFYGVSQNPFYRLSTPVKGSDGIGSTITAGGRYTLWRGAQIMEGMGYPVIYGDTDSVLIQLAEEDEDVTPKEVVERGKEVEKKLNERMDEVADEFGIGDEHPFLKDSDLHGNDRHCLHWEFEKLYRRFLQAGTKKRYAGLPFWKEGKYYIDDPDSVNFNIEEVDPDITGFESKRSDTPEITAEIQTEIIERVLAGNSFEDLSEYLSMKINQIRNVENSDELELWEIANPGVINKPLDQYGNTPTIRACRFSNDILDHDWREGDDPWIYYVKSTPSMTPDTDVIALEWGESIPDGFELDTDKVIQKKIKKPLEPILGETPYSFTELSTGRRNKGTGIGSSGENPFKGKQPTINESKSSSNIAERESRTEESKRSKSGNDNNSDSSNQSGKDALSW